MADSLPRAQREPGELLPSRRVLLLTLLFAGLLLPFINKPVHIDDANFLVLAQGVRLDFWRPHNIQINWLGTTQRAFDVLSNPPGIGWWLAPWVKAPLAIQHLMIMIWFPLALGGASVLGKRFAGSAVGTLLLLNTSPIVLLAAQALTPDLPLLACTLAGLGGFIREFDQKRLRLAWSWAVLAGCAFLFRYSGSVVVPLLLLYAAIRRGPVWPVSGALLAPFFLFVHDQHAYGAIHFVAMSTFQSPGPPDWAVIFHKGVAAVAVFGGAGIIPLLALRRVGLAGIALVFGGALGALAAVWTGQDTSQAAATVLFVAAGVMGLANLVPWSKKRSALTSQPIRDRLFLASWAIGGLCFLLTLRLMAARYWLPFLAPLALVSLVPAPSRKLFTAAVVLQITLALGICIDDFQQALADQRAAEKMDRVARTQFGAANVPLLFAGHWGWQHALESRGWVSLEEDSMPPMGSLLATAVYPWPQSPAKSTCLEQLWEETIPDRWPGPRVHTWAGRAHIHSNHVCGTLIVATFAPWTLADDDREKAVLFRVCKSK